MTNPTPQGLPPHFPHEADRETGEGLEPACSVSKLHEYAERYAREALRAQAASVEPVVLDTYDAGLLNDFGGGNVEWWLDYIRHELGAAHDFYQEQVSDLYASATPSPASVAEVDVPLRKVVFSVLEGFTLPHAVRKILEAAYYTPSPAQVVAVDAVDELREALRMGVECLRNWKILHPEDFDSLDERAIRLMKTALKTALATKEK